MMRNCRCPGIRNDTKRAKETGDTYNPNGTGVAWSHNFLNQKPWHPLNFRNQKAKFDAEEKAFKDAKTNQIAQVGNFATSLPIAWLATPHPDQLVVKSFLLW